MTDELLNKTETQEQRVSLIQQVREGLLADEKVYFAGEISHSPYGGSWTEAVDIIVAPVEPTYDPEKLNQFMDNLVPDIPRSARDSAGKYNKKSDFRLGKLYFDETLGTTEREIKSTTTAVIEPETLERAGVSVGVHRKTVKEHHKRRTWVRVYPDASSAKAIADYEQGIEEGIIEPDSNFGYMKHWLSAKQYEQIKKISGKRSKFRLPKPAEGQ